VLLDMIGACTLQLLFWLVMFISGVANQRPNIESV
jgi:hypothetical protein